MPKEDSTHQARVDQLIQALRAQIQGIPISGSVPIAEIARRMASQIPREHSGNRLAEKIGPFYDTEGAVNWLGISRQAIRKRREALTILGCRAANGRFIYPVWQFQNDGTLIAGLSEVLKVLSLGIDDPWTWALWLQSAVDGELDGKTVTQWLRDGGDVEPVLELARNDAAAWAT